MAEKIVRPDFSFVKTVYKELGNYLKALQRKMQVSTLYTICQSVLKASSILFRV